MVNNKEDKSYDTFVEGIATLFNPGDIEADFQLFIPINSSSNQINIGLDGKGHMVFNWFEWKRDGKDIPKIHPTQKPVNLLKKLIETFTDEGDVVIDPVAGSGSTLRACLETNRTCYGFEIKKEFYNKAKNEMLKDIETQMTLF